MSMSGPLYGLMNGSMSPLLLVTACFLLLTCPEERAAAAQNSRPATRALAVGPAAFCFSGVEWCRLGASVIAMGH